MGYYLAAVREAGGECSVGHRGSAWDRETGFRMNMNGSTIVRLSCADTSVDVEATVVTKVKHTRHTTLISSEPK